MMAMTARSQRKALELIEAIESTWTNPNANRTVTRTDIMAIASKASSDGTPFGWPSWLTGEAKYRAGRGVFRLPTKQEFLNGNPAPAVTSTTTSAEAVPTAPVIKGIEIPAVSSDAPAPVVDAAKSVFTAAATVMAGADGLSWVPNKDALFVPWGNYDLILKTILSKVFFPIYIVGHTGNGKTLQVEQACAAAGREFFRVNITAETEEDDLLGQFQLRDGNTVWEDGPVTQSLKRGGVLLLDELDLASPRILCLQSILEGKGVLIKRTGQWIPASRGFTIIATANTKGRSDESGRYVGTNTQNDAFLERFVFTLEQDYPTAAVERKIVNHNLKHYNAADSDFAAILVKWAGLTREGFANGTLEEFITTRRLCHIAKTFALVHDRARAVELCVSRFESVTRSALLDLYRKLDATSPAQSADPDAADAPAEEEPTPF